ncbi:MAG TPA: S8 family peptidase, partial [Candidatus Nanoarchaeia archaeon]|nr:S8 family peptidase [Candidatus Nanoarchaeia archaeon]
MGVKILESKAAGYKPFFLCVAMIFILSVWIYASDNSQGYFSPAIHGLVSSLNNSDSELPEIIKTNEHKLNDATKRHLNSLAVDYTDKYILRFKKQINENKLDKVNVKKTMPKLRIASIDANRKEAINLLKDSEIESLELDQSIEQLSDNIPYGVYKTNAPPIWNNTKGKGVKVAILDTGISKHPDLSIAGGVSIISEDYIDNNGHGTAVAGVVSALLNDEGLVGVAPETNLYAVKIMEGFYGDLSNAIGGVEWAIDNNMNIISMSFGMEAYSQIFKKVLDEAYANGTLIVAAAGNNGRDILYPAAYSSVIAVGATDENNERASFSSFGADMELVAAGVSINSTSLADTYSLSSGTSMAAPHVAGVAALVWAYNKSLTNKQVRAKLRNDALDLGELGRDDYYGYGLVQANIQSNNLSSVDERYFYEVYNITGYGTPLQEL